VQQAGGKALASWQRAPAPVPPARLAEFGRPWCSEWPADVDPAVYTQAADAVLQGRWRVFALHDAQLGFPPRWNVDPLTGTQAPMRVGKRLNYRDERLVGNIKYLWEPSRHLELTTLAQAYRLTGDTRYLEGCRTLLTSWFEQCPYPLGVHWASSLELAIRLLNWATAWHLLGGQHSALFHGPQGQALQARWLESIYRHASFIEGYFSRYSSANNHLLGEYMGLFIAGVTWPCWDVAARWRDKGHQGFEHEALRQTSEDGVNREQAIYYHHEVADMMLICGLFGQGNGVSFSPAYWARLEAMLDFIAALRDRGGHLPMIGDSDDALMVRFDPAADFDPYASLLDTGAALFGRPDLHTGRPGDRKTGWLLGARPVRVPAAGGAGGRSAFPEGGYWVLSSQRGQPGEVRAVVDAGPLGYLSIAAHGHADALSVALSIDGEEVLIDPGTFAYHTQPAWRNYFRGTSAHNTVRIDGQDQSVIGGNFMWLDKARARCVEHHSDAAGERWVGEHDGYARLADPVVHRRTVELDKRAGCITITDVLTCKGRHGVELHWHLAEGLQPALQPDGGLALQVGGHEVSFRFSGTPSRLTLHRGEVEPPLGWASRRFDTKTPTWVARCHAEIDGSSSFVCRISWEKAAGMRPAPPERAGQGAPAGRP
jgi:hypothetical protein